MTKVFDVMNKLLHHYYPEFASIEDTKGKFSDEIKFVEAPDWCFSGYGYLEEAEGDDRFIRPALPEGFIYNDDGFPTSPESYRRCERDRLHERIDADMLTAMNGILSQDGHDWVGWAATLKAYAEAVDDTVNQENYPHEVTYPDYPTRPWESE